MKKAFFYLDSLYNDKDFQLNIERIIYEGLCKDLWENCIVIIEEALKLVNIKKDNNWWNYINR